MSFLNDVKLISQLTLTEHHRLSIVAARGFKYVRFEYFYWYLNSCGFNRNKSFACFLCIRPLGTFLEIMIVRIERKFKLRHFDVVFANSEKMRDIHISVFFQCQLGKRLIEVAHFLCEGKDDFHSNRRVLFNELGELLITNCNKHDISERNCSFNLIMPRHAGNYT